MIGPLLPLLLAYLVVAWLGGIGGVLLLAGVGVVGCGVMFGAEALHAWRAARAERRTVYRRWASWSIHDLARRHRSRR